MNYKVQNLFTVDVEEYFHVNNLAQVIRPSQWDSCESRISESMYKILVLLDTLRVKATFFVLGWVAKRYPKLVKEIYSRGHEIASHGMGHKRICDIKPDEFRKDICESKSLLESIIGEPIYGYRAPTYSISKETLWALDILIEEGFRYDSSIFPFRYEKSGLADDKRFPHVIQRSGGSLWEFPVSTFKVANVNLPFSGGGYFRLCPYQVIRSQIAKINSQGQPTVVYIHPWEFDPEQPRFKINALGAFRHYYGLKHTESKVKRVLSDFAFSSIRDYMQVNCKEHGVSALGCRGE